MNFFFTFPRPAFILYLAYYVPYSSPEHQFVQTKAKLF